MYVPLAPDWEIKIQNSGLVKFNVILPYIVGINSCGT